MLIYYLTLTSSAWWWFPTPLWRSIDGSRGSPFTGKTKHGLFERPSLTVEFCLAIYRLFLRLFFYDQPVANSNEPRKLYCNTRQSIATYASRHHIPFQSRNDDLLIGRLEANKTLFRPHPRFPFAEEFTRHDHRQRQHHITAAFRSDEARIMTHHQQIFFNKLFPPLAVRGSIVGLSPSMVGSHGNVSSAAMT